MALWWRPGAKLGSHNHPFSWGEKGYFCMKSKQIHPLPRVQTYPSYTQEALKKIVWLGERTWNWEAEGIRAPEPLPAGSEKWPQPQTCPKPKPTLSWLLFPCPVPSCALSAGNRGLRTTRWRVWKFLVLTFLSKQQFLGNYSPSQGPKYQLITILIIINNIN